MGNKRNILLKYWDYTKNQHLDPNTVKISSEDRVHLKCPDCGFVWESRIVSFTARCLKYGCPKCAGRRTQKRRDPVRPLNTSQKLDALIRRISQDNKFVIYQVLFGPDKQKFLLDLQNVLTKSQWLLFNDFIIQKKTMREIGLGHNMTRARVGQLMNVVYNKTYELMSKKDYDKHLFGIDPQKAVQEYKYLQEFGRGLRAQPVVIDHKPHI